MPETESTRNFDLEKLSRGVTKCQITSLLAQSTSKFALGIGHVPCRKKSMFALRPLKIQGTPSRVMELTRDCLPIPSAAAEP